MDNPVIFAFNLIVRSVPNTSPPHFKIIDLASIIDTKEFGSFRSYDAAIDARIGLLQEKLKIIKVDSDLYQIQYGEICVAGCERPLSLEQVVSLCSGKSIDAKRLPGYPA